MSIYSFLLWATLLSTHPPIILPMPQLPDPEHIPLQTQAFLPAKSPPTTIPAFPEQSNLDACPLDLPDELFSGVKSACGSGSSGRTHRTRCCPVLAAWLYAAYSRAALERAANAGERERQTAARGIDMPVLPEDSETCVGVLEKALVNRGVKLGLQNETCDAVYCYCGIRLRPLSCPEAFYVNSDGKMVGGGRVKKLERDCLNGYAGLAGCSTCLNTLYKLNIEKAGNTSKFQDRKAKIRSRDCELMGLTWLLNKNRTAYIHTVSAVLRALMMSTDGTDPESCTLNSDGMPLPVGLSEINDQSAASRALQTPLYLGIPPLLLSYIAFVV